MPGTAGAPAIPGSPIPLAAGDYLGAQAQATQAYNQALAQINQNRQSAMQTYGYTGTIDPTTGTITNMKVDPNNPFGEYQQMLRTHALDQQQIESGNMQRGLGAAAGARGGGLAAQNIAADHQSFGADSANLGESMMNNLEGLQGQQTSAQQTMDNTLWQAETQAAQNAILQQMFDQANFGGLPDIPYGDPNTDPGGGGGTDWSGIQLKPGGKVYDSSGGYYDPARSVYVPAKSPILPKPKAKVTPTVVNTVRKKVR
jgi:hypothetical protein